MSMPVVPRLVTTSIDGRQQSLSRLAVAVEDAPTVLDRLAAITALVAELRMWERLDVEEAYDQGVSWSVIGKQLGVSKQAAAKRFGVKPEPAETDVEAHPAARRSEPAGWDVTLLGGLTVLRVVKRRGSS